MPGGSQGANGLIVQLKNGQQNAPEDNYCR